MSILRRRAMMQPPDLGYVRDGLILHLDGIYNTYAGHDPSATEWYDLSGSGNSAEVVDGVWSDNSLIPNGSCISRLPFKNLNFGFEIIVKYINGVTSSFINPIDSNNNPVGVSGLTLFTDNLLRIGYSTGNSPGSYIETGIDKTEASARPYYYAGFFEEGTGSSNRQLSVYVDGAFVGEGVRGIMSDQTAVRTSFGRDMRWGGFGGANEIYMVRIYNRALTADEVAHNYTIDAARFGLESAGGGNNTLIIITFYAISLCDEVAA